MAPSTAEFEKMTLKDYQAIASVLRRRRAIGNGLLLLDSLVEDFADMFASNRWFDRERFIADCEADGTVVEPFVGPFGRRK